MIGILDQITSSTKYLNIGFSLEKQKMQNNAFQYLAFQCYRKIGFIYTHISALIHFISFFTKMVYAVAERALFHENNSFANAVSFQTHSEKHLNTKYIIKLLGKC